MGSKKEIRSWEVGNATELGLLEAWGKREKKLFQEEEGINRAPIRGGLTKKRF